MKVQLSDVMDVFEKSATPGPWYHGISAMDQNAIGDNSHNLYDDNDCDVVSPDAKLFPSDAEFIALFRTHGRKLLDLWDECRKIKDRASAYEGTPLTARQAKDFVWFVYECLRDPLNSLDIEVEVKG